ncbi:MULTISPECIES: outer membrane protein assembly factor BamB family protein [Natrialbaceae]|uniref:outer membrane protein assembly factor BamB family protein n=1 Tax=Natrialbaceae TaxID=1644061 RepID=UPI00207CB028|nr:PQQ-binding-like beta-propeller repeat protein [Natronococcus sp. CG52]
MPTFRRRSILAACAALSTTGALASAGSTAAEETVSDSFAAGHPNGWSSALGNPANSQYLPLEEGFPEPDTVAWRYEEAGSVAAVDGRLYVRTESELQAVDAASGELQWRAEVPEGSYPAAVFEDGIFVGGENRVTALETADGSVRWEREFDTEEPVSTLTVAFETVYVVADETLHALDVADGSSRWDRETVYAYPEDDRDGNPMPVSFRPETVAVANGTVYAALKGGTYTDGRELECAFGAIDATAGEDLWGIAFDSSGACPVESPIIATGHAVYANHPGQGGFSFDLETGEVDALDRVMWAGTADARLDMGVDMRQHINMHNWETDEAWTATTQIDAWHEFVVAGDTVIARHSPYDGEEADYPDNSIVGFDLEDGTVRWALEFDGNMPPAIAAVDENTLYLEDDGELVAFRPSEAVPDDEDGSDEGEEEQDETDDSDDTEGSDDGGEEETEPDAGDEDDDSAESDGGTDDEVETDDGDEYGPGEDESDDETDSSDDGDDTGESEDGDGDEGDDEGETDDGNDGLGGTGDEDDDAESDGQDDTDDAGDADDAESDDDSMPGFTTGAGILGGAATLEWLRRKAGTAAPAEPGEPAESTEADEPAE